jgi:catechol 2,3-dioxygenase-like lactoylglutathione lyase family enzyme
MPILGVESLIYGVEDLELCRRFWRDFGLTERHCAADRVEFETGEGTTVIVRPHTSPDLPPAPSEARNTVREVVWGVETAADLAEIAAALAGVPGFEQRADVVRATDPNGYALAFKVTARRALPQEPPEEYNVARTVRRAGRRAKLYAQASPRMMSHVVFYAPRLQEAHDFYTQRLGFRLTDSYPGRSMFFRADGAVQHHNLFLLQAGEQTGFHHVAFEVGSVHELFGGGLRMTDQGWKTAMGPGRHPVSSAYFWYFVNPSGGAAEYDWDSDVADDSWEAREWPVVNTTFAEWMVPDGVKRFQGFAPRKP